MRMPSCCTSSPRATFQGSAGEVRVGPSSKRLHTGSLTTNIMPQRGSGSGDKEWAQLARGPAAHHPLLLPPVSSSCYCNCPQQTCSEIAIPHITHCS